LPPQIDLELAPFTLRRMMRPPRLHLKTAPTALKKLDRVYSDFFNRIGQ